MKRRVFTFDTSPADERYFRAQLYLLHVGKREAKDSFRDSLWDMIFERNDNGKTSKYLYFNERSQKLYVDYAFEAWARKAFDEIAAKLNK